MSSPKRFSSVLKPDRLFERIVSILDQTRGNVVRSVNTNMVLAYWLIEREIVEEIQRGKKRAEYGKQLIENLSQRLTERCGQGFLVINLQWFRKFFLFIVNASQFHTQRVWNLTHLALPAKGVRY